MAAKRVTIEFADRNYHATVDGGPRFFVGRKVSYEDKWGLMNLEASPENLYDPKAHQAAYGFWAEFIHPIAQCESRGSYHCLNTYDRARFTFGFLQYAAHVPGGDFVRFFRGLLATSPGADYFPDLTLRNAVICRESVGGPVPLETSQSTVALQDYLNPSVDEVEEAEAIQAAKFVHWSQNEPEHREVQVRCGVEHIKRAMQYYAKTYSLDGALDKICLVIADIHHQGRGKKIEVFSALDTTGDTERAYANLLEIGAAFYPERVSTLKATIDGMVEAGRLGQRKYNTAQGDFVSRTVSPIARRSTARRQRRSRR